MVLTFAYRDYYYYWQSSKNNVESQGRRHELLTRGGDLHASNLPILNSNFSSKLTHLISKILKTHWYDLSFLVAISGESPTELRTRVEGGGGTRTPPTRRRRPCRKSTKCSKYCDGNMGDIPWLPYDSRTPFCSRKAHQMQCSERQRLYEGAKEKVSRSVKLNRKRE